MAKRPAQSTCETIYASIPGFPGYRVGTDGSVWTCWKRIWPVGGGRGCKFTQGGVWRQMQPATLVRSGYLQLTLYKDGKKYQRKVHHLVLLTFVGPRPPGRQACHENDIPGDCRLDNVYWGTPHDNHEDQRRNGGMVIGEAHYNAALTEAAVRDIVQRHNDGEKMSSIRKDYREIGRTQLSNIIHGWSWNHITGLPRRTQATAAG